MKETREERLLSAGRRLDPGRLPADFVDGVLARIRKERAGRPAAMGSRAGIVDELESLFPLGAVLAVLVLVAGIGGEVWQSRRDGGLQACLVRAAGAVALGGEGGRP